MSGCSLQCPEHGVFKKAETTSEHLARAAAAGELRGSGSLKQAVVTEAEIVSHGVLTFGS